MTGVIVQARMGSSRFPGKVMKEIFGKPILRHLTDRLEQSKEADRIIIATTESEQDRAIVKFAERNGIDYFAGDEQDVLDRYYKAAKHFELEHIVRVTGDCPLIDPEVVDKVIGAYRSEKGKACYVSNVHPPTYPDGLDTEVFSFDVLEAAWKEAKEKYQREHVTPFMWEQAERFVKVNVVNEEDFSYLRWTMDEEIDFNFIERIFEEIYPKKKHFLMNDIINLLREKPELIKINNSIKRNEGFVKT